MVDRLREIMRRGWPQVPTMLTVDPPGHTRYRGTVAPYFTPRSIAALRDPVEEIVDRLIDGWIDEGDIEFVADFAVPLPIEAIAYVLNVPARAHGRLQALERRLHRLHRRRCRATSGASRRSRASSSSSTTSPSSSRTAAPDPRGDLMSDLVQAEIDTDDGTDRPLEMAEMLSIVQQLLVAGNETTTKALTEGVCCWPATRTSGRP